MLEFYFLVQSMSRIAFAMKAITDSQEDRALSVHLEGDVQEMENDGP
jgi:hypothetical protein